MRRLIVDPVTRRSRWMTDLDDAVERLEWSVQTAARDLFRGCISPTALKDHAAVLCAQHKDLVDLGSRPEHLNLLLTAGRLVAQLEARAKTTYKIA